MDSDRPDEKGPDEKGPDEVGADQKGADDNAAVDPLHIKKLGEPGPEAGTWAEASASPAAGQDVWAQPTATDVIEVPPGGQQGAAVSAASYPYPTYSGDQFTAAPGYQSVPPPQMWMPPGQYLPQSNWRKRWKVPVIVGSSIVGVLMAAVAVFAVVVGSVNSAYFTGKGVVVVPCQGQSVIDELISPGADLDVWAEDGKLEGSTKLGPKKTQVNDNGRRVCYMEFQVTQLRANQSGYNVKVGISSQFVTSTALKSGAVLRPF